MDAPGNFSPVTAARARELLGIPELLAGLTDIPTLSKKINFRQRQFVLADYGAGENVAAVDNVTAFNAAYADLVAAGGGTIVLPAGDVPLNAMVGDTAARQVGVRIVGASPRTRLVFTGPMSNGLFVNAACPKLEGFKVLAAGCPNIGAGALVTIRDAAPLGSSFGQPLIHDLSLEGYQDARPSAFLLVVNAAHSRIFGTSIVGFSPTPYGTTSRGLLFRGEVDAQNRSATGDHSVVGLTIAGVQVGVEVDAGAAGAPTVEGTSFTDCAIVGAQIGLYLHADGYAAPGHSWKGGHMNCSQVCVSALSFAQFTVSDCLMYLDASTAGNQGFVLLNNCYHMKVHNNSFHRMPINGADRGDGCVGVGFTGGTALSRADNNDGFGFLDGQALIFGPATGGGNRAGGNGKNGANTGSLLAGTVTDLGGNHFF